MPIDPVSLRPPAAPVPIPIILITDQPVFAAGLQAVLSNQPALHLVGITETPARVRHLIAHAPSAVVILDDHLQGGSRALLRVVREQAPQTPVILLAAPLTMQAADDAAQAGVTHCLARDSDAAALVVAIRAAASAPCRRPAAASPCPLTAEERVILVALAQGIPIDTIAATLGWNAYTVKATLAMVMQRLHAQTRTAAVLTALREGWILASHEGPAAG